MPAFLLRSLRVRSLEANRMSNANEVECSRMRASLIGQNRFLFRNKDIIDLFSPNAYF